MKINGVNLPKSSFLSVEKDLEIVVKHLCKNERLKRLLYYTTKDAIDKPDLNDEQMIQLFNKNIKIIPKLYVDGSVLNYIVINFDNFVQMKIQNLEIILLNLILCVIMISGI